MSLRLLLIGQSLFMLIFPLAVYLSSTAWCYLLVSQDIITRSWSGYCVQCSGKQAQKNKSSSVQPSGFSLWGWCRHWQMCGPRGTLLSVSCAAVYIVMVSRKWSEVLAACARSAVAVGSHAVMTCLWGGICTVTMCKDHDQSDFREWQMSVVVVVVQSQCLRGFSPHNLAKLTLGASLLY